MTWVRTLFLGLLFVFSVVPRDAEAGKHRYTVPSFGTPPITADGGHLLEGTQVAAPLCWHARLTGKYMYGLGVADRASQIVGHFSFGMGIVERLEIALALPVGWTFGAMSRNHFVNGERFLFGMGDEGPGFGDLGLAVLVSAYDSSDGGLGLLVGVLGSAPTGKNDRLLGEGGFTVEPFVVLAFQLFGSRLSLNLSYRVRPEHALTIQDKRYEQDDDLRWRLGLRIPKKYDVTWSVELEGAIGVATYEGFWPSSDGRPVGLAAGVDFPIGRNNRLGLTVGGSVAGEAGPSVLVGMHFSWLPALPDEDGDGIDGSRDVCPLLKEDIDSFEDTDGCPDLDNDGDGFPDDEDECPQKPAGSFSEDGC